MKKTRIALVVFGLPVLIFFGAKIFRFISVDDEIKEISTSHFVIVYHGIYDQDAKDVADGLEENYKRIRAELNDPEHDIINVFIHPTQAEFNKGTGLPNSNANGTSRGPLEFHILWTNRFNSIFPDDPVQTAIHEFTHCVQLNILIKQAQEKFTAEENANFNDVFERKFIEEYPQWFWEAICVYEAKEINNISVQYAMRKNLSLKDLNKSNQIYNVGYTLIEFIVDKWGKDKLPALISSYGDIHAVLKVSESDFEKGWIEFVKARY